MLETLERGILDPITELPPYGLTANRPLEFTGKRAPSPEGHGIFLVDHQYPRPEMKTTYASSRDSEGEKRFDKPKPGNRKIPIKVFISEAQGVGAVTNLATNPGGEVVKKFSNSTDYVVTRELGTAAIPSLTGEYRDKHAYDGAGTNPIVGSLGGVVLPAAGTYCFSVFIWIPTAWDGGKIVLTNSGTFAGSTGEAFTEADLAKRDQWQRLQVKNTFVAGDLSGVLDLYALSAPSSVGTGVIYSDALQIESGSAPTAFLSGDTPGCYWNGKPNESSSTRVGSGSDKKRAVRCLYDIQEKVEKLSEEGGTYKRILPNGEWMVFDVEDASFVGEWMKQFNQGQQEFSFELTCKPGARLSPITLATREEKALPVMTFTETDIPGNLAALGDLLIEDIQGVDRDFVAVAAASRFLDTSATAEPFYEAESRQRLSGAALAAGSGVPSGAGSNVVSCTLVEEYTPYLSTRSLGGVHATHVGAQHVFARIWRPTANTGDFGARLEYSQGDLLRWRALDPVTLAAGTGEGEWMIVDLGVVRLNRASVGAQRWEGRLALMSSVVGDTAQIDWIALLPCEEFYAEARALSVPSILGPQIGRDNFLGSVAPLTGRAANLGGNWTNLGGDADDFVTNGGGVLTRSPATVDVSGANNHPITSFHTVMGRYARLGAGTQPAVAVSADVDMPMPGPFLMSRGLLARITDINNMLMGWVLLDASSSGATFLYLQAYKKKAGAWTWKASVGLTGLVTPGSILNLLLYCAADGSGMVALRSGATYIATAQWKADADLATAGTLQTGGYGVYSSIGAHPKYPGFPLGAVPSIPTFDSFTARNVAEAANVDAAVYANRDLRVRWDSATREAADGSGAMADVGSYNGDRLLVPHSGRESRPVRFSVLGSRVVPNQGGDVQADDIKATLTVTPRVTEVPEAL